MNEQALREKARAAITSGRLPNRSPDRTWGGPGVGAPCVICDLPVRADNMEFEIQFAHEDDDPGLEKYHVHIRCFAAWEFERNGKPTCDLCLMPVLAGQPVVYQDDGRLEHVECPLVRCIRCLLPVRAGEARRWIGEDVLHVICSPDGLGAPPLVDNDST